MNTATRTTVLMLKTKSNPENFTLKTEESSGREEYKN